VGGGGGGRGGGEVIHLKCADGRCTPAANRQRRPTPCGAAEFGDVGFGVKGGAPGESTVVSFLGMSRFLLGNWWVFCVLVEGGVYRMCLLGGARRGCVFKGPVTSSSTPVFPASFGWTKCVLGRLALLVAAIQQGKKKGTLPSDIHENRGEGSGTGTPGHSNGCGGGRGVWGWGWVGSVGIDRAPKVIQATKATNECMNGKVKSKRPERDSGFSH